MSTSALSAAITFWKRGCAIPRALYVRLISDGYDVAALEQRYRS
jgi:hypothetical protein